MNSPSRSVGRGFGGLSRYKHRFFNYDISRIMGLINRINIKQWVVIKSRIELINTDLNSII